MSRRRGGGMTTIGKINNLGGILRSDGASQTATTMLVVFFFFIFACVAGITWQGKQLDKNYQQIFSEAGFSTPRSLDEAVVWMIRAEAPAYTLNNYQDGEALPPTYSDKYNWRVVTHSSCTKESAWIKVEYVIGNQIQEVLEIPVTLNERGSWIGNAETNAVRFETSCYIYADSLYFTTELIPK